MSHRITSLAKRLFRRFTTKKTTGVPNLLRFRPRLEACEDRTVPATLSGNLWLDYNENGTRDAGEPNAVGVMVELFDRDENYSPGSGEYGLTFTDANGDFTFTGLDGDEYTLYFNSESYTFTEPFLYTVVDVPANSSVVIDYGIGAVPPPPVVSVEKIGDATEGYSSGEFIFTRTGDASASLTIFYQLSGTATNGTDYGYLSNSITFAAGSATAQLVLNPTSDSAVEGTESVVLDGVNYDLGSNTSSELLIADVPPGNIDGRVWVDSDGDGTKDTSESWLTGVTVALLDPESNPARDADRNLVASVTTNAAGAYSFTNLYPAGYLLQFTAPSGYILEGASATRVEVGVANSGVTTSHNLPVFGDSQLSNITGQITHYQLSGDSGGAGLAGVSVTLFDSNESQIATTTTGSDGNYAFSNLAPDTYTVTFSAPAGYLFSGTDQATWSGIVNAPGSNAPLNGVAYQPTSISGNVWLDADLDGSADAGEANLSGVTVAVLDESFSVIATTTTDSSGNYTLTGLPTGAYYLQFTAPVGSYLSGDTNSRRLFLTLDNNAAPVRNIAAYSASQSAVISGRVWVDADGNRLLDGSESGLAGVGVAILQGTVTITSTTTDSSGSYSVSGLAAGAYTVRFTAPSGYWLAESRASVWATDVLAPGPSAAVNAGAYQPASAAGTVWVDTDDDGTVDIGEAAVGGATVTFYGSDGRVVTELTADTNGEFTATGLPPDAYRISIDAPEGYQLNGMPDSVFQTLTVVSGAVVTVPVAYNNLMADKHEIKFEGVDGKAITDQIDGIKSASDRAILWGLIKDHTGVDLSEKEEKAKWAKSDLIFGVAKIGAVRDAGGALQMLRVSVDDFATAPQKDKASIIQSMKNTVILFDGEGKEIEKTVTYIVEGFAVDANGLAKSLDTHMVLSLIGQTVKGKMVKSVKIEREFISGWGTFKDKPQPVVHNNFYQGAEPPAAGNITWLGKTKEYKFTYTLNTLGEWTWSDGSTGLSASGTDGNRKKN